MLTDTPHGKILRVSCDKVEKDNELGIWDENQDYLSENPIFFFV